MASQRFSIGTVGITGHLLINARKVTDPATVVASAAFAPPHPTFRNIVISGLDPENHYFDVRESPDGVALGVLYSTYEVSVKDQLVMREVRYYRVGGAGPNDPVPDQDQLVDVYLNGKTIAKVQKDGLSRPLFPPSELTKEYDLIVGGGIKLLNEQVFSNDEGVVIEIDYLADTLQPPVAGIYSGVIDIVSNTTFNATHRNKRLCCESNASAYQVNTMESLAAVPLKTLYYLHQNRGNQYQTRFICQGSDQFILGDSTFSELTIAPGEFLWVEVRLFSGTKYYEVVQYHPKIMQVFERLSGRIIHQGCKAEDGALYDGDDYPRPWWWINNRLPLHQKIIDDAVVNPGYTHPAGKEGLFVVHSSLKKFRVPNTQNLYDKALKNFNVFNADATRSYDYPGGKQDEGLKPIATGAKLLKSRIGAGGKVDGYGLNNAPNSDNYDVLDWPANAETNVNNVGWINQMRF